MCGISAIISGIEILDPVDSTSVSASTSSSTTISTTPNNIDNNDRFKNDIKERLLNRGPDSLKEMVKVVTCKNSNNSSQEIKIEIQLISSVLGLRGPLTVQPLQDDQGNILLWNGEMFGGYDIGVHDNDTCLLSHILSNLDSSNPRDFIDIIIKIKGPFAFIYWHEKERTLWFGRDVLGRRSLLVNKNESTMIIASMGSFPDGLDDTNLELLPKWDEINTFGLFSITFPQVLDSNQIKLDTHSWDLDNIVNIGMTSLDYNNDNDDGDEMVASDNNSNNNSQNDNSNNQNQNDNSNNQNQNDNSNNQNNNDSSNSNNNDNNNNNQNQNENQNEIDQLHFYPFGRRVKMSIDNYKEEEFQEYVNGFYNAISDSIHTRVCNLPNISNEIPSLIRPEFLKDNLPKALASRLAILFSGGLDSMVLAAMSDKHIPIDEPIHLINVAFGEDNANSDEFDRVPDRKAAIQGLKELEAISPSRQWKLIKVNVTNQEMDWAKKHVYQLSYPAITIMDMTICLALWFAGRGEGLVHGDIDQQQRYMTTSKVLLMGSGADEQLAGYGRHRSAFQRGSWQVLQGELNKDFNRIWKRNLGRDDRVLSSNRREPRFPYLDENLIKYLNDVPLCYVCDLSQPQGTGDKRILREVGRKLGLTESTRLIKKAIQFGSRSSKQLNKNIPARITQKCGKEVFSFTTPLYDPTQDPKFDAIQKLKLKQQKNIEKKKQIQLKKEMDLLNLKEKQQQRKELKELKEKELKNQELQN